MCSSDLGQGARHRKGGEAGQQSAAGRAHPVSPVQNDRLSRNGGRLHIRTRKGFSPTTKRVRRHCPDGPPGARWGMGKKDDYDDALERLQVAMVETQAWTIAEGRRTLIVFEGRDTAGKAGAIKRMTEYMSPRQTRVVALPKPTEREATQWYFQRYVAHLPAAGETVILNRSWYNRGGVEPVMGFCTPDQHAHFLRNAPRFERMLTDDGVVLIKLWLDISRQEQSQRLAERRDGPLKRFQLASLAAEAGARRGCVRAAGQANCVGADGGAGVGASVGVAGPERAASVGVAVGAYVVFVGTDVGAAVGSYVAVVAPELGASVGVDVGA